MKIRKSGYWKLFFTTVFLTILAILTIIPADSASKECLLGYKAFCTFTPISTVLCLLPAGIVCFVRKRFFVSYQ
ncbi:MAG: hypothetical protein A2W99_06495 [Bacteroidetes bacterium GWF2_33_16]|nr:MAG: hypothetical protein A2X00_11185 [Bacteroidetes bacterium GWE2_32_14]OFY05327.1 MAG: hypothetical protein A2W99_06495 [Bacteroidetes bacterium GWF2_33_16]